MSGFHFSSKLTKCSPKMTGPDLGKPVNVILFGKKKEKVLCRCDYNKDFEMQK